MDRFLSLFSLLLLSAAASHAALPAQVYWDTVLPKTPMPSAIRELLRPDALADEEAGTAVSVGKGGVNVGRKGVGMNVRKRQGGTQVGVNGGGVTVNTGKGKPTSQGTNVNVGHGRVNVNTGHKGKLVVVNVGRDDVFQHYGTAKTQVHNDSRVALFFLEKDLHPGAKMTLRFTDTTSDGAAFLPRQRRRASPSPPKSYRRSSTTSPSNPTL